MQPWLRDEHGFWYETDLLELEANASDEYLNQAVAEEDSVGEFYYDASTYLNGVLR